MKSVASTRDSLHEASSQRRLAKPLREPKKAKAADVSGRRVGRPQEAPTPVRRLRIVFAFDALKAWRVGESSTVKGSGLVRLPNNDEQNLPRAICISVG
jgi:hypothetical protein